MRAFGNGPWVWQVTAVVALGCAGPSVQSEASLLASRGDTAGAAALLRDHLREQPSDLAARRQLIRVLAAAGRLGEAREETEALRARLPEGDPRPLVELGHAFELSHRYEEALALYDAAAELAPNDPLGPKAGGSRAARWGELAIALPRLIEALRRDPKDAEAWHTLGLVRAQLGDLELAEQAYTRGLVADPDAAENLLGLATLAVKQDRPEEALRRYRELTAARPRFADGYLGQSWALLRLGRLDEAERALNRGVALGAERQAAARQRALLKRLREVEEVKEKR
ncbi:MAG: tetratricopeptide repeat protein [Polyangiaceae bacterium]|nr:tetratricopeptide repeat protein [Polyangiaceae bacterium]MCW5791941.1 tetratricopeptide repeat protein [Polyangiaceae bacterium]